MIPALMYVHKLVMLSLQFTLSCRETVSETVFVSWSWSRSSVESTAQDQRARHQPFGLRLEVVVLVIRAILIKKTDRISHFETFIKWQPSLGVIYLPRFLELRGCKYSHWFLWHPFRILYDSLCIFLENVLVLILVLDSTMVGGVA